MTQMTTGLTTEQADERLKQGKANVLPKRSDGGTWAIVRRNTLTLFNLLNIVLAALIILSGSYRNLLFMGVVVSNSLIGLVQELRAKRTHDRLLLLAEGKVTTLRDGVEKQLAPSALVLDDVVILRRGDQIPADAEVLDGGGEVNESLLTGESEPIPKAVGAKLLSGSYVTEGAMTARLTAVGADSYAGNLQTAARRVKRPHSELMDSMRKLLRIVSITIVPLGLLLYLKQTLALAMPMNEAIPKVVAAVLGMIPEGLILLTSVALAVGVVRLGRKKALVNELYGIESLARTDVVCLDKTGTLTSGDMRVSETIPLGDATEDNVRRWMAAFTAAFAQEQSPTQLALRKAFFREGSPAAAETVPFSSDRKWSAASWDEGSFVLGAPERTVLDAPDALKRAQEIAAGGVRVLALLRTDLPLCGKELPDGLELVGLIVIGDTLRPEARDTLEYFAQQGVACKVLSGDSALTVARIAQEVGLPGAERYVDCSALDRPIDYDAICEQYAVFGRVTPDDKRELVQAMKRRGHGVAMIGDGVNDIPALKAADCSIAIAGGSDAACRTAQLTLLDANFAVMPEIVLEGRRVINNITRASALFLVKNVYSCLLTLLLLALPFAYPFAPIQLTLVSSLTIGFPSFVLALQPNRDRVSGSFLRNVFTRALPGGLCVTLLCTALMLAAGALSMSEETVSTLCTVVASWTGLCVLTNVCLPLDKIRAALVALMTVATVAAMLLFPQVFYLALPTGAIRWAIAAILVAVPLLLWGLQAALNALPKRDRSAAQAKGKAL